jgi:hypothetical protein
MGSAGQVSSGRSSNGLSRAGESGGKSRVIRPGEVGVGRAGQ